MRRTRTCRRQYLTSPYLVNTSAELHERHWRWLTVVDPIRAWDGPQTAPTINSFIRVSGLSASDDGCPTALVSGRCPPISARGHTQIGEAMTDPMTSLHDEIGILGVALARWSERDDTRPQPEIRQASNTAVDAVDELTRRLFALRRRLVTEIRASDDATAARVDALLARPRGPELARHIDGEDDQIRTEGPDTANA
jgi:hypothetical protein